jgi:hypothetical protein
MTRFHRIAPFIALVLAACTSTTEVMVNRDQLYDLAGLEADKERTFTAVGHAEPMVARGSDEVRLLVMPGHMPGTPGEPWVRLCDLRYVPSGEEAPPDSVLSYSVDAPKIAGADVRIRKPDAGLTVLLITGIVVGTAAAFFGGLAILATTTARETAPATFR